MSETDSTTRSPGGADWVLSGPLRRTLFVLAVPVLAEQLLNTLVGLFDTFLAGRISRSATSAIGLAAYVDWLVSMVIMLVATGTTALVSRHEGSRDHASANRFCNQSMTLAVGQGAVLLVIMYALAPVLARHCRLTGEAFDITVNYLRVAAVGHMVLSPTLVGCAALRGVGNMRKPLAIWTLINLSNVAASVCLVYGVGPIPAFGVRGIVLGTVIARTLGACLITAVLISGKSGLVLRLRELPLRWDCVLRILRIGVPAAADGIVMWFGHFLFLAIVARLTEGALQEAYFAAHMIAVRTEAFAYLPAVAWGTATATMIGQNLGAADPARAKRAGHEGALQCGVLSVFIMIFFFLGSSAIYALMSNDPLVRQVGTAPFRVLALIQPMLVVSIVYVHGLRGAGDTRFPLLITMVGALCLRVPLGYLGGISLGAGLLGAWMGMFGDITWRAICAFLRFSHGRWSSTRV